MADTSKPTPGPEEGARYAAEGGFPLFVKLFVVPALIVLAAVAVFLLAIRLTQATHSPDQYLQDLRSDSTQKRWQAAYELSKLIAQDPKVSQDPALRTAAVAAFSEGGKDDPRLRSYLALVLGNLKEKSAVPTLEDGLLSADAEVRLHCLWALGEIGDTSAGDSILKAAEDPDAGVRLMAIGALSALRYAGAKDLFLKTLAGTETELRYDAAVGLARLKDPKAEPALLEMLSLSDPKAPLTQSAKLAALDAFKELPTQKLRQQVVVLSKEDPDLKVREAALTSLKP